MKAVVLREVGGDLALEEQTEPDSGHVVDVRAAGVNFADLLIRRGLYPQMPELPYVLGSEVAGELDGRRVVAFTRGGGGYAERAVVDPDWTFELPQDAPFATGAAFLTTYLTAYIPLVNAARRETVLVHAGAGGVGSAAIQIARHLGATVHATASSDEKRDVVGRLGAEPCAYEQIDDLRVDLVLDPVGGDVFTRSLPLLNPLGTIVAIGFAGGFWEDPSVQWLVGRNATVSGFYLGRLLRLQPSFVRTCVAELLELWRAGVLEPFVGATFPLADANSAHALIESRRHVGKVVLEP
ncbi:MAG TPA: zinc-binding dehydrogenase [Gaiellaceae bacterium]|nr:zinc-binding dehydrogenase [Gaiellaceae bacterium]